jgi:Methyltransferase involved in Williams-Beuren syndrome
LASDPEALTALSGACNTYYIILAYPSANLFSCPAIEPDPNLLLKSAAATYLHCTRYSISVLQWLLNAETSHPTSSPPHRLTRFFTTLHSALRNPSRAILQFYPTSDDQIQLITSIAQRAGFGGGVVVDYPNSKKARKVFLCLFVGDGGSSQVPKGLEGDDAAFAEGEDAKAGAKFEKRRQRESRRERNGKQKVIKGGKDWILRKKDVRSYPSVAFPPPPPLIDHF